MVPPASSAGTNITFGTSSTTLMNGTDDGLISFPELEGKVTDEQVRQPVARVSSMFLTS